jgi:hypothetical protein
VLELTPEGIHTYGGGYTEYVARTGQEAPGLQKKGEAPLKIYAFSSQIIAICTMVFAQPFPCPAGSPIRGASETRGSPAKMLGQGRPMKERREPSVPPRIEVRFGLHARHGGLPSMAYVEDVRDDGRSTSFMLRYCSAHLESVA